MTCPAFDDIPQLDAHCDAEALRDYDHPAESLRRWEGILTAKAWIGSSLACFFAGREEGAVRIVLIFKPKHFRPMIDGPDMREAVVGSLYELDVFATAHHVPIIDRIERVKQFT